MQSAYNISNAIGAALGGLVLTAGFGYAAPPVVGAILAALGVGVAVLARRGARTAQPVQA
jgi:DHA1 family inner membrane transport protein